LALTPHGWSVTLGRRLHWPVTAASPGVAAVLPGMQTDIELIHRINERKVVIDTKFTNIFTNSEYRTDILKGAYLYQMYAYLRTQERLDESGVLRAEGMLLHPQIGGAVNEWANIQGYIMRFKTIDLTAEPGKFELSLRSILV
jgi:5-methylcytosine-specific restriction enzyme subunit McrC